jgi:hypothetical protein
MNEEASQARREADLYKELLEQQRQDYEERLRLQREASKFYNRDGFWIAFWIIGPLVLLALGIDI